jgi:acyl-CoA reductase-like NAD-dependent aldehyde dehydrogenase
VSRLTVPKTYKLYIGGKFPRSESGRTYEVVSASGDFLANAAKASRKDARDAVVAARAAVGTDDANAVRRRAGADHQRIRRTIARRAADWLASTSIMWLPRPRCVRHGPGAG